MNIQNKIYIEKLLPKIANTKLVSWAYFYRGKMKKNLIYFSIIFLLSACSNVNNKPLGSKDNPIKLYFTPSIDATEVATKADTLVKLLEKESGYCISSAVPTSYVVVTEAFGTNKCDIACMNSFGYVLAHNKYGANALLRILRNGESFYRGEIIAHVDSGIKNLKDIDKKKFAFTDPSSTSGYLLPLKLFRENKVVPSEYVFAMRHDNVVIMVYQKKVDAGACFYAPPEEGKIKDARARVITQFPDIEEKVKIIQLTDPIPNDPIVFRKNLPQDIKDKMVKAIKKIMNTEEGKSAFYSIYSANGVVETKDADYDVLNNLLDITGKSAEELLKN